MQTVFLNPSEDSKMSELALKCAFLGFGLACCVMLIRASGKRVSR